ncbi:MAG: TRAP transporter substrate-binding protein [Synergistaceae bacterium]|jgi:tripartite ATP-independent transporter DctP family solute receptor|nr:TRAP transporter substrate-binding protein [Synergistaceae bacterium]
MLAKRFLKGIGICLVLAVCAMVFGAAACDAAEKKITIKFAHWYADTHPQHLAIQRFKELVEERSGGSITVEIYSNSQLGSEDVFIDGVSQGIIEMGSSGTMIEKFVPKIAIAEAPFLFNGWKDAEGVFRGEIGKFITALLPEKANMYCAAITVNGFRQFSSNKSMASIDLFKGQRIRVPNVPHFIQMVEQLGGVAVPMALSELFTALEGKVVDGQENPAPTIYTSSFWEVQKYVLRSNHMFSPNFWIINKPFYDAMSDAQKKAFDSSIQEAAAYNWQISKAADDEAFAGLKAKGVEIQEPDAAYRKALQDSQEPVYKYFFSRKEGAEEVVSMIRKYQASN